MAVFRKIHVTFWSDSYVSDLKEREKLFYLYILTNERTTQLGVYEITKKQISFDLGYNIDTVSILLSKFEKDGKIKYNSFTSELAIKNWNKYNGNTSSKVQVLINKEIDKVKDKTLIQYQYSIDTVPIHNLQEEEEQEEEKAIVKEKEKLYFPFESEIFLKVWNLLLTQPKWKKKSNTALQASLKKLSEHDEQTAIKMMENTIAGEWQGLFEIKQQNNKQGNGQPSKMAQYKQASMDADAYFKEKYGE